MNIFRKLSIINKNLRYKLAIAFSLMTVIPLLACVYSLGPYLYPGFQTVADVNILMPMSVLIAILGLIVARGIVNAVVELAMEARKIANGDYARKITVSTDDEVGNLGRSINIMTQKIKSSLDELKAYGQSMKEINVEIHKKMLALSSLLQIGDIISAETLQIDSLLELAVEKAASLFDTGFGILYMPVKEGSRDFVMKTSYNISKENLPDVMVKKGGHGLLENVLEKRTILRIDDSAKASKELEDFKQGFNVKNLLIVPICSDKAVFGILAIGNRLSDFKYTADDIDLVMVFAKHMTIAIESDILNRRNEELATRDNLTGLFNKRYIVGRLEEEIKRAIFYQRPCSFIALNIDNFKDFRAFHGELAAEEALRRIARMIKDSTIPVGKTARIGGDEFAMLLPEKNKREAAGIAEDVRKMIGSANVLKDGSASLTVSVGVSENPIDGATGDELFKKAVNAVEKAKLLGKNKIVA